VLVVCVDCLRADHVHGGYADTPFLDSLQAAGLAATDMYAAATTTSPCVAGLLTGTHAERHGVLSLAVGPLAGDVRTFAERFAAAGDRPEALVTGPLLAETSLDRPASGTTASRPSRVRPRGQPGRIRARAGHPPPAAVPDAVLGDGREGGKHRQADGQPDDRRDEVPGLQTRR
jgi:hypothetical protein